MRHWSRNLAGGIGREILDEVTEIENREIELSQLKKKIEKLERDIQIREHELLENIRKEWSTIEISNAREFSNNNL
ncbi:hypothetical protein [uncultured Flavobacterium sp.]|uniref:hypothetical protein n=1 Tax=uncultured Flavobacterium sp. TaxID=165435 RepID=UPI00259A6AA3|nr:hypothetical protein [uncultured Flavobacterium sp.]